MKFISDYFNLESTDKRVREWFVLYIRYVFASIKVFCQKKKYINRIITFLSVLSESSLMTIDFIKDIVIQSAQLCYSKDTFFLSYFFDVKTEKIIKSDQIPENDCNCCQFIENSIEAFNQEVKTLSVYKTKKIPFRKSGNALLPVIKGAITEANFFIDPRVADLGISSKFSPFIYIDETLDPSSQKLIKYSLTEIIDQQNALIQDCLDAKNMTSAFFDTSKISNVFSTFSTTLSYFSIQNNQSIRSSSSCNKLVSPSLFSLHPSSSFSTLKSYSFDENVKPFYITNHKLFVNIMNSLLIEMEQDIFLFQKTTIESFITMTNDLIQILNQNPHLGVNSKKLIIHFEKERTDIPKYSEIKDKKNTLIIYTKNMYNKILAIVPPRMSFSTKLTKAMHLYEYSAYNHFLPYNEFDIFFADYVNQDKFKSLINAVVELVKNDNDNTFSFTVDGVVFKMIKDQHATSQHDRSVMHSILFPTLIRVIFSTAYDDNSVLYQRNEDNLHFLKRAENLAKETLKSLDLEIFNNSPNESIKSFFSQDQIPNLRWLLFETNPLDICYEIHKTITDLIKELQIPKKAINKCLTESLLYCVIISNPPENIMGIARLLFKWNNIYLIKEFEDIRNSFIKAVSRVQMIEL